MAWNKEALRIKWKELRLKYAEKDFDKMVKKKKIKGMNWEDFIFWAVINSSKVKK